jgi:hypothetical protein
MFSRPCGRCQITPLSRRTRQWWVMVDFTTSSGRSALQLSSLPSASRRIIDSRSGLPRAKAHFPAVFVQFQGGWDHRFPAYGVRLSYINNRSTRKK